MKTRTTRWRVLIYQLTNLPIYQLLFGAEALSAAAGGRRVRILDREAAAGNGVDKVDFGAVQVPNADRIHEQLDAVRFEHLVARPLAVLFDHQAVLETRTAAALDEHAQAAAAFLFLGQQVVNLGCRRFGYVNHANIIARRWRMSRFWAENGKI